MAYEPFPHNIIIDFNRLKYQIRKMKIAQFDNIGHRFRFQIMNDIEPHDITDMTGKVFFQKADDTIVFSDCTVEDATNGILYCDLTAQTLACLGDVLCELILYGTNNEKLTSATFKFSVIDSIMDDNAIESTSEFTALTNAISQIAAFETSLGSLVDLTTANKTSIVQATNEVNAKAGTLASLNTTTKTNLVAAVNELLAKIGTVANLTTVEKTNLVGAVNELAANMASLAELDTADKTSIVAAINEIVLKIGGLATLTTTEKNSIVGAINELVASVVRIDATLAEYTTAEMNIYVSLTGSDANTGLDVDHPLRTLQAAVDKIPNKVAHPVSIHMAAGTYPETALIDFRRIACIETGAIFVWSPVCADYDHCEVKIWAPMIMSALDITFYYTHLRPTASGVGIKIYNKSTFALENNSVLHAGSVSLSPNDVCKGLDAWDSKVKILNGSYAGYCQPSSSYYDIGCVYVNYGFFYSWDSTFANNTYALVMDYSLGMIGSAIYTNNTANTTLRASSQIWGDVT